LPALLLKSGLLKLELQYLGRGRKDISEADGKILKQYCSMFESSESFEGSALHCCANLRAPRQPSLKTSSGTDQIDARIVRTAGKRQGSVLSNGASERRLRLYCLLRDLVYSSSLLFKRLPLVHLLNNGNQFE
jgi:hypothetical protein